MTLVPTGRQVALWGLPLVLSVLAIGVPLLLPVMIVVDLMLVAVLVIDGMLASGDVKLARELPQVAAVNEPFAVGVSIDNVGGRALRIRLQDEAPGQVTGLPLEADLPPGRGVDLSYEVKLTRRGQHRFEGFAVRWVSPLGLWERQIRREAPAGVRVYPDFGALRTYGLASELAERQAPVRAQRRPGGENEFQRLRPYVQGDAFRHIDWRATARRGEFVTREYGQESNQNVIFLLDAGRMTSATYGQLTAFDHALNAALMMGQLALRRGDRVGLMAYDDRVRAWVPPKGGRRSGAALIRSTYDLFPSLSEPDHAAAFRHLASRVRRRSLVVLFTAVVDEVNAEAATRLVRVLGKRHLPVVVWLRDPGLDEALGSDDPYVRGAAAELAAFRADALQQARQSGAIVVDAPIDGLTPALLNAYLEVKARRLL